MKCSVLISYYNDKDFLKQSIDSVLNQSFKDFELILIDHASLDESSNIAHSFDDKRIKHIKMKENIGGGGSELFLKFLQEASGEYIKTFCADDIMQKDCLQKLVNFLDTHKEFDIVACDMFDIDLHGKLYKNQTDKCILLKTLNHFELINAMFNLRNPFSYPTMLIRKDAIKERYIDRIAIQLFDIRLWIHLLLNGHHCGLVDEKLIQYRHHKNQLSGRFATSNITNREIFEAYHLLNIFLEKMDIQTAQMVFPNIPNDEDLLKFNLCKIALDNSHPSMRISALHSLYNMLQNDGLRDLAHKKYNFTIADIRQLICDKKFSNNIIKNCHFIKKIIINLLKIAGLHNISRKICHYVLP